MQRCATVLFVLSGLALAGLCAAAGSRADGLSWEAAVPLSELRTDWLKQDAGASAGQCFTDAAGHLRERALVEHVLRELRSVTALRQRLRMLTGSAVPGTDQRWRDLYWEACQQRRQQRLIGLRHQYPVLVYTRHFNLGGSHYAYTEAQSDAQAERNFVPGGALCLLRLEGATERTATLLEDSDGVIRDPDVSYDGRSILFSWKQSDREDDYHLYEMDADTGEIRQITHGLGVADYEGIYLPNGDLLFNSTRCVQTVDCWWTEVSNLYTCARDGRFLRRLSFDQVHTNYPQVLADGRVVYTRWDYNDRGQIFPQPLFQMNPDGTAQTACYGNNSWFPTTLIHARGIPCSDKLVAIATGHHSDQSGKLVLVDRNAGQEENAGVQLIAPVRDTPAVRVDAYGQEGDQFAYPFALSENEFIVTYTPDPDPRPGTISTGRFGIYWMAADGRRELLACHPDQSCNQALPLTPRPRPKLRPSTVDYRKQTGTYYLQDIYVGAGLPGVPRGAIKRLRVIGLDFRAAGIGSNTNAGPAGGAVVSTPIAIGNGAWDVKVVYGDAEVYPDGSAAFEVPARVPLYFQALDADGYAVQTMRTWSTLQPGETFSCVGCHENKPHAPATGRPYPLAMRQGAQPLQPFYGPPRGFSFIGEVQPILDRHCVSCHSDRSRTRPSIPAHLTPQRLAKATTLRGADAPWQYTTVQPSAGWEEPGYDDSAWGSGVGGFGMAGTPGLNLRTQWLTSDIWLRGTFEAPADISDHELVALVYHDEDVEAYLNGVLALRAEGYVVAPGPLPVRAEAVAALKSGVNTIAVHCHQTVGGQGIEVVLLDAGPRPVLTEGAGKAFSLLGDQTPEPASGRAWSDAYLALTTAQAPAGTYAGHSGALVNWVGAQSVPSMLPPYFAGAATSGLLQMLREGHNGVQLTREELDKIACWIDLNVPYCGDYTEANCWSEEQKARYQHFLSKRQRLRAKEQRNIEALIREQGR